ncbi:MAG: flagellar biosynthesis protein FlhB [Alphaproteobacteria bacterium]|nr:MAG: flagellar biosynthesis protein FlhB [Alphaproteobacteria bacterium]
MAEDQDESQKTEAPTSKRLSEAREQGNIPVSREVGSWFLLLGGLSITAMLAAPLSKTFIDNMKSLLEHVDDTEVTTSNVGGIMLSALAAPGWPAALVFLLLLVVAIAGTMIQTGLFYSTQLLAPQWSRLSPLEGMKRLVSIHSVVEMIKGMLKLALVGTVAWMILSPALEHSETMVGLGMVEISHHLKNKVVHLAGSVLLAASLVAIGDLIWQRMEYYRRLRMTKQEVKDEFRQSEGDPVVKSRLRQIRMRRARQRMMAQIPKADVVITNPTHVAVALRYAPSEMRAPMVLAKGADLIAKRIRDVAKEHGVPLVENPPLARTLYATVEIDQEIPTQHYRAVAEIISYVFRLKNQKI